MKESFTIEEIKNYIKSQDSLGDVLYFLNAENIRKANQKEEETEKVMYNCRFFDECQGRHKCTNPDSDINKCVGVCPCYVPKRDF